MNDNPQLKKKRNKAKTLDDRFDKTPLDNACANATPAATVPLRVPSFFRST